MQRARQAGLEHTRASSVLANNTGAALVQLGRWDEARAIIEDLLLDRSMAESLFPRLTLAEIAVCRGEFDAVDESVARLREAGEAVRQPQFIGSVYAYTAEAAIWRGRYEPAREAVTEGITALVGTEHHAMLLRLCALGLRNEADEWLRRRALPGTAKADLATIESTMDSLVAMADSQRGTGAGPALPDVTALLRLCEAERDRTGATGREPGWAQVAQTWETLDRPYPAAYAWWREAEAAARARRVPEASHAARLAHRIAVEHRASALLAEIVALASRARLRLEVEETGGSTRAAAAGPTGNPFNLTGRERDVLRLLCDGCTNQQLAEQLYISKKTAEVHVSNILRKLDVATRLEAAATCHQLGLFPAEAGD
jgi:ATP/maltotriose-dependent transcriptional regulator MalT